MKPRGHRESGMRCEQPLATLRTWWLEMVSSTISLRASGKRSRNTDEQLSRWAVAARASALSLTWTPIWYGNYSRSKVHPESSVDQQASAPSSARMEAPSLFRSMSRAERESVRIAARVLSCITNKWFTVNRIASNSTVVEDMTRFNLQHTRFQVQEYDMPP